MGEVISGYTDILIQILIMRSTNFFEFVVLIEFDTKRTIDAIVAYERS